ncbi:MAG TPA: ATP-binding protein [Gemmatimonadales bacterium]|nr:ATP-binding protein [Gemmatimonadales bacterium]
MGTQTVPLVLRALGRPFSRESRAEAGQRRSLGAELLFNLGFLTAAAILLVGTTTLFLARLDGDGVAWGLLALWLLDTLVFLVFGAYVIRRLVLRPLDELAAGADAVAAGDLTRPRPVFDVREFVHLQSRFEAMAEQLLDAQSQVVRAEKLAGIGRLSAGVAHEIRNPLGALANYVEVLRHREVEPEVVGAMSHEIQRIDRIVQGLLDYARPAAKRGPADLNQVVRETVELLARQGALPAERVRLELDPALPLVNGDPHALQQVLVNLLLNACDAAPGRPVHLGTVARQLKPRFEADREPRRDDAAPAPPAGRRSSRRPWRADLERGAWGALLYVADEGPGVPEADRERIFDPFYTTKEPGKGTGLGLAIVARTVHDAGGIVWVDRAREGGAVFKVFLPQAKGSHAPADR